MKVLIVLALIIGSFLLPGEVNSIALKTSANVLLAGNFADCNNPGSIQTWVEPCTTVQAQIIGWKWFGVGHYDWYIDGQLYIACVDDIVVDYSLITNPLNLTNGTHTFSVKGTLSTCAPCGYSGASGTFQISCL